ncbi:unnamed protein product [Candidula unifasciata]|uniref:RNA methyltransferase n=1 Tax=Candidula unifasciata TaxID=100452 RepID=A0A8S3YKS7_9EUPU|nr:unnamed protein product [Candidula unifasciata]
MIKRRLLLWKFNRADQFNLPVEICLVIKRFKKQYASLHCLDKKLFVFPNTPVDQLSLPGRVAVCKNLADFKIQTVKCGFQRRPELIVNNDALHFENSGETFDQVTLLDKFSPRYTKNKRIQQELVEKAVNLFHDIEINRSTNSYSDNFRKDKTNTLVLDIGCGDGTSTQPLLDMGYPCVGIDLNLRGLSEFQMSNFKRRRPFQKEITVNHTGESLQPCSVGLNFVTSSTSKQADNWANGDFRDISTVSSNAKYISTGFTDIIRWDLRHGLPFRAGTFDFAISISFLQWLFYGNRQRQLRLFFSSLKSLLTPQGKAVIQFYPMNPGQLADAILYAAEYFQGVVVGDYPHVDRGRKLFLVIFNDVGDKGVEKEFDRSRQAVRM